MKPRSSPCPQDLQEELRARQAEQASLQALWSQLRPEHRSEESDEAQEKLHVTGSKLRSLLRDVDQDLSVLQQRLVAVNLLHFEFFFFVLKLQIKYFYRF